MFSTSCPLNFELLGMVTETVAVVPFAPMTSTGSVTVPEVPLDPGVRLTLAVACFVESAALVAVIVTV
jgi:hypothetical protein